MLASTCGEYGVNIWFFSLPHGRGSQALVANNLLIRSRAGRAVIPGKRGHPGLKLHRAGAGRVARLRLRWTAEGGRPHMSGFSHTRGLSFLPFIRWAE